MFLNKEHNKISTAIAKEPFHVAPFFENYPPAVIPKGMQKSILSINNPELVKGFSPTSMWGREKIEKQHPATFNVAKTVHPSRYKKDGGISLVDLFNDFKEPIVRTDDGTFPLQGRWDVFERPDPFVIQELNPFQQLESVTAIAGKLLGNPNIPLDVRNELTEIFSELYVELGLTYVNILIDLHEMELLSTNTKFIDETRPDLEEFIKKELRKR